MIALSPKLTVIGVVTGVVIAIDIVVGVIAAIFHWG